MPRKTANTQQIARLIIACDAGAPVPSGSRGTNAAGQPTQRFAKAIIKVGDFVHPNSGQPFKVDGAWIDNAIAEFDRMKTAGVSVPLMSGHSDSAPDTRGQVLRLYRGTLSDGTDALFAEEEAVGEDAIVEAARNDRSIYAESKFKDANGNEYEWAIQHVALTPVPVIPGLPPAVAIAASRGSGGKTEQVPVYRLDTKGSTMNEYLAKVAGLLGISLDGKDEAAVWKEVEAKCAGMKASTDQAASVKASLQKEQEKTKTLAAELAAAKKDNPEPTAIELKLSRKNRELVLSGLLSETKITKEEYEGYLGMYVGTDGLALAATLDTPNDERFEAHMAILAKRQPARPTGIQAGRQTITASRENPDEKKSGLNPELEKHRDERRKQRAEAAGRS